MNIFGLNVSDVSRSSAYMTRLGSSPVSFSISGIKRRRFFMWYVFVGIAGSSLFGPRNAESRVIGTGPGQSNDVAGCMSYL